MKIAYSKVDPLDQMADFPPMTPEERFAKRKAGTKAAWVVKRFGLRLLPELYEHLSPMPYEAAAQVEQDIADDLRRAGYTVTGGH